MVISPIKDKTDDYDIDDRINEEVESERTYIDGLIEEVGEENYVLLARAIIETHLNKIVENL